MILPIPYLFDKKMIIEAEIKKPTPGVIAETQEMAQKNIFSGMLEFVSGCLSTLMTEEKQYIEQSQFKNAVREMPYLDVEYLSLMSMSLIAGNLIEGVYECPRCGHKIICEESEGYDTRDSLNMLVVRNIDSPQTISIALESPIKLINKKDNTIIEEVSTIEIRIPTMRDCIQAANQSTNDVKRQLNMYASSIISVNGESRAFNWINTWGSLIFSKVSFEDIKKIGDFLNELGLQKTIERICPKCSKRWQSPLDLWNFFGSGLR